MSVSADDNTVTCGECQTRFQYYGVEIDAHCPECGAAYPPVEGAAPSEAEMDADFLKHGAD